MPGVYGLAGAQHRLPKACAPRGVCAGLALWQGSPCLRFSSAPRWSCRSRSRATKAASRYRTCGAPAGSMDGAAGASKAEEVPVGGWKTCRRCQGKFHEGTRIGGCTFHPESFSGETAQRWLPPGVTEGGGDVHYFWTCCGHADKDHPGCSTKDHASYDDDDDD